jgi:hypothetical protein
MIFNAWFHARIPRATVLIFALRTCLFLKDLRPLRPAPALINYRLRRVELSRALRAAFFSRICAPPDLPPR